MGWLAVEDLGRIGVVGMRHPVTSVIMDRTPALGLAQRRLASFLGQTAR